MRITGGKVFEVDGFVSRDVFTEGGLISEQSTDGQVIDAKDCYVIPGLTDIHFHGCMGSDFSDGEGEGLAKMAEYELSRGVTQICPAGMTLTEEQLQKVCQTAAEHRRERRAGAELCGINLEGPFLSWEKRGAQNGDWLLPPDIALLRRLMETSCGLVKLVSIAPELPGAIPFIEEAGKELTVSLAHTAADYETASAAFRAGARQVTHLFNAMPPFGHRAPGVVGAAFDCPECMVELICDGIHIHPSVVRAVFKMFGDDRVILISDSIRATGLKDGQYTLGGQDITVNGRLSTLKDGTIAGSVTDLMDCIRVAVSMGIPPASAVKAAAVNPARAIGIGDRAGSLDAGRPANIAILNEDFTLKEVIFNGSLQKK